MGSKKNNQLREKIIIQTFEIGATSAGITRPAELRIFHALLGADRGVFKP